MTNPPATVSSAQVSLILERASEIDARGDVLTIEELRQIATEAGIDAAATEIAIQEIMADREAASVSAVSEAGEGNRLPVKNPKSPSPAWIVAGGAVGMTLGFITALPGVVGIPAFGATVIYLVVRALQSMKKRSQLSFQLQNFAVWFGMAMGGTAIGAVSDIETLAAALIFWIVSSVVGGLIVQFGPREEEPADPTSTAPLLPSPDRSGGSAGGGPTTHSA